MGKVFEKCAHEPRTRTFLQSLKLFGPSVLWLQSTRYLKDTLTATVKKKWISTKATLPYFAKGHLLLFIIFISRYKLK